MTTQNSVKQEPQEFPVRTQAEREALERDLAEVLNRHGVENFSNTPDFLLAEYLVDCADAFAVASRRREQWYGKALCIGGIAQVDRATGNHVTGPIEVRFVDIELRTLSDEAERGLLGDVGKAESGGD